VGQKGSKGEREVVKRCQEWWRRVHSKKFRACGDLLVDPETKRWPFAVEVKRREAWNLEWLIAGRASPVWGWWLSTQEDGRKLELEPMLWFRKNRMPWLVLLRFEYISAIRGVPPPQATWSPVDLGTKVGELPALYFADRLLEVDPALFAK
jgi:hypothetical protein